MKILYYLSSGFSIIALGFYSLPWIYGTDSFALNLYIIAILWFLIAWIFLVIHFILGICNFKNKKGKHNFISSFIILICYFILIIAIINDYIVLY